MSKETDGTVQVEGKSAFAKEIEAYMDAHPLPSGPKMPGVRVAAQVKADLERIKGGPIPNFVAPDLAGYCCQAKKLWLADEEARRLGNILICRQERHFHLREARILLLFRSGLKANADGLVELGKASKASPMVQAVGVRAGEEGIDFIISLNAEKWPDADLHQRVRLMEHELLHCGVTIAGKFVALGNLDSVVAGLGKDHLETCDRQQDGHGRVLVRFRKRIGDVKPGVGGWKDQPYAWRIRKHDYEDFTELMAEYGLPKDVAKRIVDEMEPPDDGQMALPLGEEEKSTTTCLPGQPESVRLGRQEGTKDTKEEKAEMARPRACSYIRRRHAGRRV